MVIRVPGKYYILQIHLTFKLLKETKQTSAKNLTEKTSAGFFWMILGSGTQVVLKIGVLAVLARLVSPKEFGIMGIAVMVVEFSKMLAHMGVGPALVQRKELEARHLTTGFTLSLMMGAFFASLLFLIAPYLSIFFGIEELTKVLRVTSLVFLIDSFSLIAQALIQRNMKFRISSTLEVISYAIGYGGVGISLAYAGWGVWALVGATLSQAALFTTLITMAQPFPKKPGFELDAFKELIFFGGGMTLAKVGNFLATQGDNLVVGRMLGPGALGIYGRAYQFMVMPASLFGNALDKALFPAFAKVQDDKKKLAKAYLTGVGIIALAAIPISLIIILLAKDIVMVLLGSNWVEVIVPLQILSASLLFRMSYKMSDSLARATGAVYRRAWRQLIYASVVLIGSYLGQFLGLYGVACGVCFALITNFVIMGQLSLQLTDLTWSDMLKAHKHGLVLGLITGLMSYALVSLCRMYNVPSIFTLIITAAGAAFPLAITLFYFPSLIVSTELKELSDTLILKRFKKLQPKNA